MIRYLLVVLLLALPAVYAGRVILAHQSVDEFLASGPPPCVGDDCDLDAILASRDALSDESRLGDANLLHRFSLLIGAFVSAILLTIAAVLGRESKVGRSGAIACMVAVGLIVVGLGAQLFFGETVSFSSAVTD